MKSGNLFMLLVLQMIFLGGCTEMISIGHTKTYCEEHCGSYEDAGVCARPYDIFENRHEYARRAERENQSCGACR